ncbi:MAG: transglutaminase domain-containing protein [Thermoguttaceae bacterium]
MLKKDLAVLTLGWTFAAAWGAALPVLAGLTGCRPAATDSAGTEKSPTSATPAPTYPAHSVRREANGPRSVPDTVQSAPAGPPHAGASASPRETWEVICLRDVRVGYQHTALRHADREGRPVVAVEEESRMVLRRDNTPTTLETQFREFDTPAGAVLEFEGSNPLMQLHGRVAGDRLEMTTTTRAKQITTTLPWNAKYQGVAGVQESLRKKPMKPGERREIFALDASIGQVLANDLTARDMEETALLSGKATLLRIDATANLEKQTISETLWTDAAGEIQKTRMDLLGAAAETFRAPKEVALAESSPGDLDLIRTISVPVSRPLTQPHATRRIRYRVHLDGADPATVFPSGPSQQVKSLDPHTAEITVYAIRPGDRFGNAGAAADPPTAADREPNNLIQSDDAAIVAAAEKAAGGKKDAWEVVRALESFVYGVITEKDYTQAFDSAADVIRSHRGDCTEHAVLLAALARARGIPARTAIGMVYQHQAFLYHMWAEVYLDGRWIPVDGTLARGGIGAAHLKLAHSSLVGASAYSAILPVAKVAGNLKVEIMDVE